MSAQAMLREVRKIRVELEAVPYGRMVSIQAAVPGWNDHEIGCIDPWEDNSGCRMVVGSEHEDDPVRGLDDRQRAWLRIGDKVEVFGEFPCDDGTCFSYGFVWDDDPRPPEPPELKPERTTATGRSDADERDTRLHSRDCVGDRGPVPDGNPEPIGPNRFTPNPRFTSERVKG